MRLTLFVYTDTASVTRPQWVKRYFYTATFLLYIPHYGVVAKHQMWQGRLAKNTTFHVTRNVNGQNTLHAWPQKESGCWHNLGYLSQKRRFCKMWFTPNLSISEMPYDFNILHRSTAVLCAKFQKHWVTAINDIDEWEFDRFEFKTSLEGLRRFYQDSLKIPKTEENFTHLTQRGLNKMVAILQGLFSNAFSGGKLPNFD